MDDWLLPTADRAVLVTVAGIEGSVPRETGARMLVDATRQWGTVGGGHLEQRGADIARAMLADGTARRLERFALGPSLGQCCGGIVHLAFELTQCEHLAALAARRGEDCWRAVALDGAPDIALFDARGRQVQGGRAPAFAHAGTTRVLKETDGRRWLLDAVPAPRAHLMLFGAGHVGAAIVKIVAELHCRITWVDEREDMFPDRSNLSDNVAIEATDTPEALAQAAPAGTSFLVMTHSHALDQRLAETILKRPGHDWFGLIGSNTKRRQFEHRLRERGVDRARLDAMVCPVGVPGIEGKQPAVIAVAVAAQLLMVWETTASEPAAPAPRIPLEQH